jgi:transketolase
VPGTGSHRSSEDSACLTCSDDDLKAVAQRIRESILTTVSNAGVGHPGGSLSAVEILTTLYFSELRTDPARADWRIRDRFILSKGHASSALYATLAEKGFISSDLLSTFGKINSLLQIHPDMHKVPGVEISTGALGLGLSVGTGMALAAKQDYPDKPGEPGVRVYVLLGDGECQEGVVWEAAMAAAHYKLDNLVAIVDYNQVQLYGPIAEIMEIAPLADKWRSFGWAVHEAQGHDIGGLCSCYKEARKVKGSPSVIIAHTVKGKGVSFMEGNAAWHGRPPKKDELKAALEEVRTCNQ